MLTSEVILNILIGILKNKEVHDMILRSAAYVAVTYVITRIVGFVFGGIRKKFESTQQITGAAVFLPVQGPLVMYLWIVCMYDVAEILQLHEVPFWKNLEIVMTAYVIFWLIFGIIGQWAKRIINKKQQKGGTIDYGGIMFVERMLQFVAFFAISLFTMSELGLNLQSLLTIGGIGGLTIGLAARDTIANIFGAVLLYIDKPFTVGEWISSPDKSIEGVVQDIGWRRTTILALARFPIYVSNSLFTNMVVENKGRMTCRCINEIIPIRFVDLDKLEKITSEVRQMLLDDANISRKGFTLVFFESVARPSALNLKFLAHTTAIDLPGHAEIRQKVLLRAMRIIKENGGELAYNVSHVTLNNSSGRDDGIISDDGMF
ncbi:MAG: mechanosensitive ion channel family protein [Rickettsiales bacterium]|jgi:MscS family membrane protein|nr:mechanosensitive ion channel family protein [Rickettsiales bacterium]